MGDLKGIHPPEGGWKERTYYVVDVRMHLTNPVHRVIFYSGFLDDGTPCGYNQLWHGVYEDRYNIKDAYYLKAIRKIQMED
jgi:hypothetical protein